MTIARERGMGFSHENKDETEDGILGRPISNEHSSNPKELPSSSRLPSRDPISSRPLIKTLIRSRTSVQGLDATKQYHKVEFNSPVSNTAPFATSVPREVRDLYQSFKFPMCKSLGECLDPFRSMFRSSHPWVPVEALSFLGNLAISLYESLANSQQQVGSLARAQCGLIGFPAYF